MTKKELMRILNNLCKAKEWVIIKPSLFIGNSKTVIIADVYGKKVGSLYHVYVDTARRIFETQYLSPFDIHPIEKDSLDRFM